VRLAYVEFDGAAALRAAAVQQVIDEPFLRQYCGRVVAATERILEWLRA
jgi:aspartate aminotransferase